MNTRSTVLCVLLAAAHAPVATAESSWTTYQGGPSHTGYAPLSLHTQNFALRWQKTIPGNMALNPVATGDGKVFVSQRGYFSNQGLYTLNAATGQTLWNINYGSVYSVNPPAYAFGNVYVQTGDHSSDTYLRAYHANDGALAFRSAHAAQWESYYAPTIYDRTVYVNGGYYGGMYGFDALDGTQRWFQELPQYDDWTPAVDANLAYAYVGEYNPGLYAFNRNTGAPAFTIPDPNFDWNGWSMNLAPVLGSQNNALAIHDGRMISFDLQNRRIGWELHRNFTGQPTLADGVIYAIDSGALTARKEGTGDLLWSWEPAGGGSLNGSMIATNNLLFVHSSSTTFAVDLTTHQSTWSFADSGELALGEGALWIANANGRLTAISVPEPGSVALMTVGLMAVASRRRKLPCNT